MLVPIVGTALGIAAFLMVVAVFHRRARRIRVQTGRESIVGRAGVARTRLAPAGMVFLDGELWEALSAEAEVPPGSPVLVRGVQGLTLIVSPVETPVGAYYGR